MLNLVDFSRGVTLPRFDSKYLKKWLPLSVVLVAVAISFFYGWYFDNSLPHPNADWVNHHLSTTVAHQFANGQLPNAYQLHYPPGYPLLGAVGYAFSQTDPFMLVGFALLMASVTLCFLAVRKLFGPVWAVAFCGLLFAWDGYARTFNFASELFVIPWNNQVLFLAFAFYFWLFITKMSKPPSWRLLVAASLISGLTFLAREETILFIAPIMTTFLIVTKSDWRKYVLSFAIIIACFLPQIAIKLIASERIDTSGRDFSYSQLAGHYLQPKLFYRNVWETIIDSKHFVIKGYVRDKSTPKEVSLFQIGTDNPKRLALLQAAPWLWLAPIGIGIVLFRKRYPLGLKIFMIASMWLMVFYLSGVNMSAHKLKFHCLRYISPSFIALNLGVIIVAREAQQGITLFIKNSRAEKTKKSKK